MSSSNTPPPPPILSNMIANEPSMQKALQSIQRKSIEKKQIEMFKTVKGIALNQIGHKTTVPKESHLPENVGVTYTIQICGQHDSSSKIPIVVKKKKGPEDKPTAKAEYLMIEGADKFDSLLENGRLVEMSIYIKSSDFFKTVPTQGIHAGCFLEFGNVRIQYEKKQHPKTKIWEDKYYGQADQFAVVEPPLHIAEWGNGKLFKIPKMIKLQSTIPTSTNATPLLLEWLFWRRANKTMEEQVREATVTATSLDALCTPIAIFVPVQNIFFREPAIFDANNQCIEEQTEPIPGIIGFKTMAKGDEDLSAFPVAVVSRDGLSRLDVVLSHQKDNQKYVVRAYLDGLFKVNQDPGSVEGEEKKAKSFGADNYYGITNISDWRAIFAVNHPSMILLLRPKAKGKISIEPIGFSGVSEDPGLLEDFPDEGVQVKGGGGGGGGGEDSNDGSGKSVSGESTESAGGKSNGSKQQTQESSGTVATAEAQMANIDFNADVVGCKMLFREFMRDYSFLIQAPDLPNTDALEDCTRLSNDVDMFKIDNIDMLYYMHKDRPAVRPVNVTQFIRNPWNMDPGCDIKNLREWHGSQTEFLSTGSHQWEIRILIGPYGDRMKGPDDMAELGEAIAGIGLNLNEMFCGQQKPDGRPATAYAANKLIRAIAWANAKIKLTAQKKKDLAYCKTINDFAARLEEKDRAEYAKVFGEEAAKEKWSFGTVNVEVLGTYIFVHWAIRSEVRMPTKKRPLEHSIGGSDHGHGPSKHHKTGSIDGGH